MKNANYFFYYFLILIFIYFASIFHYSNRKPLNLQEEPIIVSNFNYEEFSSTGEQLFLKGEKLKRTINESTFNFIDGYYKQKKDDEEIYFRGEKAHFQHKNSFKLEKNVHITKNNSSFQTDNVIYDFKTTRFFAPDSVKIIFDNTILSGRNLVYDLKSKKLTIQNIKGKLWLSNLKSL